MRKITSLLMALMFVVTTAMAQNYEPRNNGTKQRSDRNVSQVSLTSGTYGKSSYDLTGAEQKQDWTDKTASVVFKAAPGETVTVAAQTTGSWVHYSVFIDVDADGFTFGIEEGSSWKPTGDLVAYSFYNNNGAEDGSGWNSVGDVVAGDGRNKPAIPAFAVPSVAGTYRMRIVQDWCSIDPAGDADGKFSDFKANGGQIIDVTLEVAGTPATPEPAYIYQKISHSNWDVTAFNETPIQGNGIEGGVTFIEDEKTNTFYHSAWGGTNANWGDDGIQGFLIELPEATNIDRLTYAGRSDGSNSGWATKVRIYVYNSLPEGFPVLNQLTKEQKNSQFARGQAWLGTPAFDNYNNAWAGDKNLKTADFASTQTGKYVFFVMDGGYDAWLTCSDIQLYKKVEAPTYSAINASEFVANKKYVIKNVSNSRSGYLHVGANNALCIGDLDNINNATDNYLFMAMPTNSGLVLKAVEGGYVPTGDGAGTNLSATTVSKAAVVTVAAKGGTFPETTLNMLVNGNYCNVNPGAFCTWNDKNDANGVWEFYAIEEIANVEAAQMTTVTGLAEQALTLDGVGYPVASERENLNNTVAAAKAFNTSGAWYEEMVNTLTAYASTNNVKMPEDGKAYTFTNVHPNATYGQRYLHYNNDGVLTATARGTATAEELPISAKFICKQLEDGRFVFVNNNGKYLVWRGKDGGTNNHSGGVDAYNNDYCPMTFVKMGLNGANTSAAASIQDLFGFVAFGGKRNDTQNSYFLTSNNNNTIFNQDGDWTLRYSNEHSTAFKVEEVTYPNKPLANNAQGVEGVAAISTFCAPFATVAPNNVEVYIAASDESHYIKLQKVEGAVPANTGVVLVSEVAGQTITMVPATTEELAYVEGNLLRGDAAKADYTVDAAVKAYVLGAVEGVAGFYPLSASDRTIKQGKAYLELDASLSAVKLYFGGDEATGIETVVKENANAPIFDLSGRRVVNVAKGGIYIQNGKKFIVK